MRSAVLEDGTFGAGPRAGAQPSEETGTDGTFTLEHLRAGTYTVRAAAFGGSAVFGAPPLGGIRLPEGGAVDGLELRLGPACTLRGVVRDPDGAPVGGAAVFVRDASGRLVESVSSVVTDVAGRFSCAGIPAGDASVAARDGARASAEVHAHADASSPADVELTLVPGTTLLVECTLEDEPVRARVRVLDEHGHDLAAMLSQQDLDESLATGLSSRTRRVGPLPPGAVTVIATGANGEAAQEAVAIGADGGEREVRLRLR